MNLEDGVARLVENLQAAARAAVARQLDGEGVAPVRQEEALVDRLVEHEAVHVAERDVAVAPDLLVHGGFVAGQRHHLAERRQRQDEAAHVVIEPRDLGAIVRCEQLGLRDAHAGGEVARPHAALKQRLRRGARLNASSLVHLRQGSICSK